VPGASNLLGSTPDLAPIIEAAHAVGAYVYVDAVHLAPHRAINIAELQCDALVTSPYKWYGPHSGVLWMRPELLESLPVYKVRPATDHGPGRLETGMPNFEAIAGIEAAARFLIEEGMDRITAAESEVFTQLLSGLKSINGVRVWGSQTLFSRVPTAAFTIEGVHPAEASKALGGRGIAVWDGHNYAVEVVDQLGLADSGGVVRAGVVRYVEQPDVDRLLNAVSDLAP
ncbi:MAG: aminotransferase class V-fold PLP-dependent enzyme, partial [Ilumatobacteraceae bacterium]